MKLATLFALLFALGHSLTASAETLTIVGSGTVATAIGSAIEQFRKTSGIKVDLQLQPSVRGIFALAEGQAQIGLTIADVSDAQRKLYPAVDFRSTAVGRGGIYLIVSPDVWNAGVHSLSREQMLGIVNKETVSWTTLGGPDVPIVFVPPGAGSLANFGKWLLGAVSPELEARMKPFAVVSKASGIGDTTRSVDIAKCRGVLAAMSERFRPGDGKPLKLAILTPEGSVEPTPANIGSGRYPISFDLQVITDGPPQGLAKSAIEFLLTDTAQALIEAEGYARAPTAAQKASK